MKGRKAGDLRARSEDELTEEVDTLGKEIFNLRFQRASGQLENTARVRQVRRDIARIKTILGERRRQVGALALRLHARRHVDHDRVQQCAAGARDWPLLDSLGQPYAIGPHHVHCSVSMGIVLQGRTAFVIAHPQLVVTT